MTTPPGWYPDPSGHGRVRWWDGAAWTEHVEVAPASETPQMAPQATAPWPQPNAAGTASPASPQPTPSPTSTQPTRSTPPPPPPVPPMPAAPPLYSSGQNRGNGSLAIDWSQKPSYFKRFLAWFLDSLFSGWPIVIGLIVTLAVIGANDVNPDPDVIDTQLHGGAVLAIVLSILIGCGLTFALFVWNQFVRQGRTGQTVGKKSLGLALVNVDGGTPCSGWRAFSRMLIVNAISSFTLGIFRLIDALWPLWDARGQRVVDKMLNTVVVRVRQQ